MSSFSKSYEAKLTDKKWMNFWNEKKFCQADAKSEKKPYCIVMPPPNVTGVLHMGHALVNTLQDILIRWKRMQGYEVLWVPGTDHAGIATQTVVEQHLIRTENKRRTDYPREEFLKHVWNWKEKSQHRIIEQLQKIGCSCDWSRLRFTMDDGNNRAVRTMFKKLFDAGLIYRGDYLVNWDTVTQTALSDDEVEYEERSSFLWVIKYPLADHSGSISVATTRPETMLGDTAVAVSPEDSRYKHLIGKTVLLPLTQRCIPIIADSSVDPTFGTGAVKITPAHDPNDYQLAARHNLPMINIMTQNGLINEHGAPYSGQTMEQARHNIVEDLKRLGLLEKTEPHTHRVGLSYRSKAVIEPYLSKQWFLKMEGFSKHLRFIVESGQTRLLPPHWDSVYYHWIDNLRDWCISRQLWWGHQIPIWYHKKDPERMLCTDTLGVPQEVERNPQDWVQDHDVLDTWFSSALWPFSTLGWPDVTDDLKKFYPNSTLITGHDIIFFWVARMLAMGEFAMGEVPFHECFLHGLVYGKSYWRQREGGGILYVSDQEKTEYDLGKIPPKEVFSKWEKMSKSKGNIIDPIEMIDQYGADAVRMALAASATQGRQIDLDRRKFEEFKNFANKIWNGARFVLLNLEANEENHAEGMTGEIFCTGIDISLLALEDRWILCTLSRTIDSVNEHLKNYTFDAAAMQAYDFFWKEFCAYYVEISKPVLFGKTGDSQQRILKQKLLVIMLCQALRLLHPMAPFITEELFTLLKDFLGQIPEPSAHIDSYTREAICALKSPACIVAPYPLSNRQFFEKETCLVQFALMEEIIYTVRNLRGEMKIPPGTSTDIYIVGNSEHLNIVQNNLHIISALIKTSHISCNATEPHLGFSAVGVVRDFKIIIPLPIEMQLQERNRLSKEKEKLETSILKIGSQLSQADFLEKAPQQLVEKQKKQLAQWENELAVIINKLSASEPKD